MRTSMRMKRLFGTAAATALLLSGPLSAAALAQEDPPAVPTGVGTGLVDSTLLGINIGTLLDLDLLDDVGRSTIDPNNGQPISEAVFNPLKLTSSVLGPLSVGSVATSSTGAPDNKTVTKSPAGNIPLPIVTGLLNGTLSSVVDADGARSSLLAGFGALNLVGGLLGMEGNEDAVTSNTNAAPANASGLRTLSIPSLELLNLGNLLTGIGLPLEGLPLVGDLTSITGLLEGLGVPGIPVAGGGMMDTDDVVGTITGLVGELDVLSGLPDADLGLPLAGGTCNSLPLVGGLLGGCTPAEGESGLPIVGDLTNVVDGTVVDEILGELGPILSGALPVLDGLNLLEVGGINAGMQATATDSLDTSVADVIAEIGFLKVANLDLLEGLNLTQGTEVLSGIGDTVSGLLNTGLGLDGLLDIDVLDITEIVEPDGDYTKALSGLTALGVNLDPSKILGGITGAQVGGALSALDILGDGGLPVLGGDMLALDGLLEGVTSILTEGLGIQVGQLQSEGFFTPVAALPPNIVAPPAQPVTPPADGKLPKTGAETALPAVLAVVLAGAAIGIRRMVRPEKVDI